MSEGQAELQTDQGVTDAVAETAKEVVATAMETATHGVETIAKIGSVSDVGMSEGQAELQTDSLGAD